MHNVNINYDEKLKLIINDKEVIILIKKSIYKNTYRSGSNSVKFAIDAPKDIKIIRKELII